MAVSVQRKRAMQIRARMLAKQKKRRVVLLSAEEIAEKRRSPRLKRALVGATALAAMRLRSTKPVFGKQQIPSRQPSRGGATPSSRGSAVAAARRKQTVTKQRFEQHAGIISLMPSSVVHYLFYHEKQTVVQMRLNGRNYYAKGVPKSVFIDWTQGAAACRTNDTSSLKRWTIGKSPSLGAYFDQHIKGKYKITLGVFRP